MKKLLAMLIVAVVPLGLVACGGDEDKGPSKADYIKDADKICARSNQETDAIFAEAAEDPNKPKPKEAQAAIRQAIPVLEKDIEELKALEAPKGDEDQVAAIWSALEEGAQKLDEASADPEASLVALASDPFSAGGKLAGEYGMKTCGPGDE